MKRFLLVFAAICVAFSCFAQDDEAIPIEKIWGVNVNPDKTVTFRFRDRNADYVVVKGDMGKYPMTKGDDDVWTVTTPHSLNGGFYEYFFIVDDVMMPDPSNYYSTQSSGIVYSIFLVPGGMGDLYSVQDVPHGTLSHVWYHSDKLGMDRMLNIYTPAGYEDGHKKLPVLYLLHGSSQFDNAWIQSGRMVQIMDNLIAQGKAEPMIVVMPNGNRQLQAAPGFDTFNLTYQAQTRKYLTKTNNGEWEAAFPEIVKYVDKHYRTISRKKGRAITGLSMGGAMSTIISANYPDLFDYVGCFSCFPMGRGETADNLYDKIEYQLTKKTPKWYYHTCGPADDLYPQVQKFWKDIEDRGIEFEHEEKGVGHDWFTWRMDLTDFVQKLFKD